MVLARLAAAALLLASLPAGAGVLYKSVDANGRVMFSDVPPPSGSRIVEQREIRGNGAIAMAAPATAATQQPSFDLDAALSQANALVDQAEHALAQARRDLWSPREGLKLDFKRRTRNDEERVAFFRKDLQLARKALVDLLREKQVAALAPGAPYVVAR